MFAIPVCLNPARDMMIRTYDIRSGKANSVRGMSFKAGGKGINVARAMKNCGCPYLLTGLVGGFAGDWIESELTEEGIVYDFVRTVSETRTNTKLLDESNGGYTEFNASGNPVTKTELDALMNKIVENLWKKDKERTAGDMLCVVLSGSIPQGVEKSVYKSMIEAIRDTKINDLKIVVDADKELLKYACEAKPFLIKPNIEEFSRLTDEKFSTVSEAVERSEKFFSDTGINVLLTCGKDGAHLACGDGSFYRKSEEIPNCLPNGAGDSMLGSFISALHMGYGMEGALEYSMKYVKGFLENENR